MGLGITNFEHEAIVESRTTIKMIKNTLELLERNDIRTMNSNIWDLKYSINHIKGQTSSNNGRLNVIDNKIDTVNENIGKIADFVNDYFSSKDNSLIKDSIFELLDEITQVENKEVFDEKVNEIKTLIKYL